MFRSLEAIFRLNIKECIYIYIYMKVKQSITDLEGPRGFQEVQTPRFQDSRHKKVVRLSAPRST